MPLKTTVLVTNITSLSDARYCAGMGVDFLAFPSHLISPQSFKDISGWVQGPKMVLDISDSAEIPDNLNDYPADLLLISRDQLNTISSRSELPLIVGLQDHASADLTRGSIEYVIVKTPFDIAEIKKFKHKILINMQPGDLTLIDQWLSLPIAGLVLQGSQETKPGLKDYDNLSLALGSLEASED